MEKSELNKKYFTKEGLEFIETLIKTLINLFNKNEFPNSNYILGLGKMEIDNQTECLGRIIGLSELIGFACQIKKIDNGKEIKMEIKYE